MEAKGSIDPILSIFTLYENVLEKLWFRKERSWWLRDMYINPTRRGHSHFLKKFKPQMPFPTLRGTVKKILSNSILSLTIYSLFHRHCKCCTT